MNVFVDSSALTKRYIDEPGSDRVDALLASASSVATSMIALPEVVSVLCRRRREGSVTARRYAQAKAALLADIEDATLIGVTEQTVARAVGMLERWPLRGSDAIHIASAAEWSCDVFASADQRQLKAARAYGLKVSDVSKK